MIINNGFLVKNDRFSLTEKHVYVLRGWLAPRTEITAFWGREPISFTVRAMTENVDERYGGSDTMVSFNFAEEPDPGKILRVYTDGERGRHLAFEISGRRLAFKRQPVKIFIDSYVVSRKDGFLRLQGWAVARETVKIAVLDANKKKIPGACEMYSRLDVADLFDEYPVDEHCGFNIELRPVPARKIYVVFRAGEDQVVQAYPTSELPVRLSHADHLIRKGTEYFRYNGFKALWTKTWDKLFNPAMRPVVYADWIKKHLPGDKELQKERAAVFDVMPLISIVVPLYKTREDYLEDLVNSVREQSYSNWELILSDGSPVDESGLSPLHAILQKMKESDSRIQVIENGRALHIAENTNAALREAKGNYVAFSDHDDRLVPSALYEVVRAVNSHADAELLYTDEDKLGIGEKYMQPNLKPDYDPDFLTSVNYICHLLVVKKSLLDKTGLLDPAFDGAQDYDFILRCTENTKPENIIHIPKILYHWRFFEGSTSANPESKTYAFEAGRRAIEAHYHRLGLPAEVRMGQFPGLYRTVYHWEDKPLVSVLIPNKDHSEDLKKCLAGMLSGKGYQNFEVIIIENNSTEEETWKTYDELKDKDSRIRVVEYKGAFNYSAINNFGASFARGEYLFLLNNDTEFISEDVIGELLMFALREDVGAVGARLYYGDDTIQHAGVIVGWGGIAGHAFVNQNRGETGYQHRIICQQDMSAVTAACMMVRKNVFDEVGGFTEELAVAFNDIDLCMKIRRTGHLIVYNPYCELYHYESKSRGLDQGDPDKVRRFQKEMAIFQKRWPEILRDGDPYYNPNLSMVTQDFSLKRN